MAFVLFDGDSVRFGDFVQQRITVLDEAWGRSIHGIRIGSPNETGRLYEQLRSSRRAQRDMEASRQYPRLVSRHGSKQHHILRETQELVERLGVPKRSLPALAFRTNPPASRLPLLHIDPAWLANGDGEAALSQALQDSLSDEKVQRLVTSGDGTIPAVCSGLQRTLDQIRLHMNAVIAGLRPSFPVAVSEKAINEIARRFTFLVVSNRSRAFYKGRELQLNNLPYRLNHLLALAAQHGTGWVSREVLERGLWPEEPNSDDAPSPRRLDDAMRRLRAAYLQRRDLSRKKVNDLFQTKRKVGYRLNLPGKEIRVM